MLEIEFLFVQGRQKMFVNFQLRQRSLFDQKLCFAQREKAAGEKRHRRVKRESRQFKILQCQQALSKASPKYPFSSWNIFRGFRRKKLKRQTRKVIEEKSFSTYTHESNEWNSRPSHDFNSATRLVSHPPETSCLIVYLHFHQQWDFFPPTVPASDVKAFRMQNYYLLRFQFSPLPPYKEKKRTQSVTFSKGLFLLSSRISYSLRLFLAPSFQDHIKKKKIYVVDYGWASFFISLLRQSESWIRLLFWFKWENRQQSSAAWGRLAGAIRDEQ